MIRLKIYKKLYSYERVIFADKAIESNADIVRYMRIREEDFPDLTISDRDETPIFDLSMSEEEMYASYDKKLRNEVRRAFKENIKFEYISNEILKNDNSVVAEIINKYYAFCDSINQSRLKKNLDRIEFEALVENGNVSASLATYEGGFVYHIYIHDDDTVMLWFSFSDYRENESCRQINGWANRGLHHKDFLEFKARGMNTYDFGGISSSLNPNGIDKFKMSFGGGIVNVGYGFVGNTVKGKLFIRLKELVSKVKK